MFFIGLMKYSNLLRVNWWVCVKCEPKSSVKVSFIVNSATCTVHTYRELKLRYSLTPWCIQITLNTNSRTQKYRYRRWVKRVFRVVDRSPSIEYTLLLCTILSNYMLSNKICWQFWFDHIFSQTYVLIVNLLGQIAGQL